MSFIRKHLHIFVCSAVLLLLAIYGATKINTALPKFIVQSPDCSETAEISIFDANDGNYYVFLPSYADLKAVTVSLPSNQKIKLGDIDLINGMDCSEFLLETAYELSGRRHTLGTLWFYQSKNVATMYVHTASESMKRIHKDKDYEESATIFLVTSDGSNVIVDNNCFFEGRGNSTWELDKRPYSLSTSPDTDLLGSGPASDWILLANAEDETNLRNKIIFDLAERVGFEWVPQTAYVDVYLNGNYNGLYLLTEKVEIHNSRLDLDIDEGDFLCKIEYGDRYDMLKNPFVTSGGRTVEITNPLWLAKSEKDRIEALVNHMEQAILSHADQNLLAIFDLDSWARRYLIDEIFDNVDADRASSYFYYSNGKFHAGPVWDYDLSMGTVSTETLPTYLVSNRLNGAGQLKAPYYNALYNNASFYERMTDIYQTEYLPALEHLRTEGIYSLAAEISDATAMNSVRWKKLFKVMSIWNNSIGQTPDDLIHYLDARVSFLSDLWVYNEDYCSLVFYFPEGKSYLTTSVKKGDSLAADYIDLDNYACVCTDTGEPFDISQPIEFDMQFVCQPLAPAKISDAPRNSLNSMATRDIITIFSLFMLVFLLAVLLVADVKSRKRSADDGSS